MNRKDSNEEKGEGKSKMNAESKKEKVGIIK
jgi:hypothetical protein